MTEKDETKALWKLCFNDSDEFTNLYFDKKYDDRINMTIRENGSLISALQMIPYSMVYGGRVIPLSYISGACTHPDYRKQGIMRHLLKETHRQMYADGVWLSALIPAEEWLFGYYGRSGYAPGFSYALRKVQYPTIPLSACKVEVCTSPGNVHFQYLDSRLRQRGSGLLHTEEDFAVIMTDMLLAGGQLLIARRNGTLCGMAFTVPEEGKVSIKEWLADDETVRDALLYTAAHVYKVEMVEYMVSSVGADAVPLGMVRVICIEKMLSLFATLHPEQTLYLCVTEDDAIPENNGYYVVKDGICSRNESPLRMVEYETCTLVRLASLLMEPERPFMSLMLN